MPLDITTPPATFAAVVVNDLGEQYRMLWVMNNIQKSCSTRIYEMNLGDPDASNGKSVGREDMKSDSGVSPSTVVTVTEP